MAWWSQAREDSAGSHEAESAARAAAVVAARRAVADAYEVERRRIERDLHDGAQQYLVNAALKLGEAQSTVAVNQDPELAQLLEEAKRSVQLAMDTVRRTVRGIQPQALADLGLHAAVEEIAAASPNPVQVHCPHPLPSIPEGVMAAAFFFVTETLTNAAKYAPDAPVTVLLVADEHLKVSVVDLGPGGARARPAHGLTGMHDRITSIGGTLTISSPPGGPTHLAASIPLLLHRGETALPLQDDTP